MKRKRPEYDFQLSVIQMAHLCGWVVAHFRAVPVKRGDKVVWQTPVDADGEGFPDLFLLHPKKGLRLVAEIKAEGGVVKPRQKEWLQWMETCGIPAYTWWPKDWAEIDSVLKGNIE